MSKSNSLISYSGKVSIKVKGKPTSTRPNSGTKWLFDSLYNLLGKKLSMDTMSVYLPSYIMLISSDVSLAKLEDLDYMYSTGNFGDVSLLHTEMPIVASNIGTSGVSFKCLLNRSNIKDSASFSTTDDAYFLLLNGARNKILAISKQSLEEAVSLRDENTSSAQAEIVWDMTFDNITSEVTE